MTTIIRDDKIYIVPPFTEEEAIKKVQLAEDAWNSLDAMRVPRSYTENSDWRNRDEFFIGREAIKEFLIRKWKKEKGYRLMKELWCFNNNRISVRFEYEWYDENEKTWKRTHGNEHWEFDENGLMRRRDMSANDIPILQSELRWRKLPANFSVFLWLNSKMPLDDYLATKIRLLLPMPQKQICLPKPTPLSFQQQRTYSTQTLYSHSTFRPPLPLRTTNLKTRFGLALASLGLIGNFYYHSTQSRNEPVSSLFCPSL